MMFYRDILSQNLIPYLPCGFIETFCHKIGSATYHAVLSFHFVTKFVYLLTMLFYRNLFVTKIYSPTYHAVFIETFCHKIGSPTYHAVLS